MKKIPYVWLMAWLFLLPGLLSAQPFYEKILDDEAICIEEVPGTGIVWLTEPDANDVEKIVLTDFNGAVQWTTTYEVQETGKWFGDDVHHRTSHRLAHFRAGVFSRIVVCGNSDGPGVGDSYPAYIEIDPTNGNIIGQEEYIGDPGSFHAVVSTGTTGFYLVGEAGDKALITRVDPLNSANNWERIRSTGSTGDYRSEYEDVEVDNGAGLVMAIGSASGPGNAYNMLVDVFDLNGNHVSETSLETGLGALKELSIQSMGNSKFLITGSIEEFFPFAMLINADGKVFWSVAGQSTDQEIDWEFLDVTQHREGNPVILVQQRNPSPIMQGGIAMLNMNGTLDWANRQNGRSFEDVIALEDKRLAYIIKSRFGAETSLFTASSVGYTGCNLQLDLTLGRVEVFDLPVFAPEPVGYNSSSPIGHTPPSASLTTRNGPCCWFPYEPFPGRIAWFCNSATLDGGPGYVQYEWRDENLNLIGTNQTITITPPPTENPELIWIYCFVTDANGCRGGDRVPLAIAPNCIWPSNGIEDQYCTGVSPQRLPVGRDLVAGWELTEEYEKTNGDPINEADISGDPSLTSPGPHMIHRMITDNFGSGTVQYEYEYEMLNCTCSTPITMGQFNDEWGNFLWGIDNPSVPEKIVKFRFQVVEPSGEVSLVNAGGQNLAHVGQPPWYWNVLLHNDSRNSGWGSHAGLNQLWLEVFYSNSPTIPTTVCGYAQDFLPVVYFPRMYVAPDEEDPVSDDPTAQVNVFPNPSDAMFTIGDLAGASTLAVFDLNGRRIKTYAVPEGAETINIDLGDQPQGTYLLLTDSPNREKVAKLIVY